MHIYRYYVQNFSALVDNNVLKCQHLVINDMSTQILLNVFNFSSRCISFLSCHDSFIFCRRYRYTAYRQFTMWIHGRIGRRNRRLLPACASKVIADSFPDAEGHYLGFKLPTLVWYLHFLVGGTHSNKLIGRLQFWLKFFTGKNEEFKPIYLMSWRLCGMD